MSNAATRTVRSERNSRPIRSQSGKESTSNTIASRIITRLLCHSQIAAASR